MEATDLRHTPQSHSLTDEEPWASVLGLTLPESPLPVWGRNLDNRCIVCAPTLIGYIPKCTVSTMQLRVRGPFPGLFTATSPAPEQ